VLDFLRFVVTEHVQVFVRFSKTFVLLFIRDFSRIFHVFENIVGSVKPSVLLASPLLCIRIGNIVLLDMVNVLFILSELVSDSVLVANIVLKAVSEDTFVLKSLYGLISKSIFCARPSYLCR